MSSNQKKRSPQIVLPASEKSGPPGAIKQPATFTIRYPGAWLALAVILVYIPTLSSGITDLDDGIFISTFRDFNENITSIFTAFTRSVFDSMNDAYYRPVFLDCMVLNYQLADHGNNIEFYHAVNILLQITAVILVYRFFIKLRIKNLHAFILTLLFAVHPVLTEAVAWIPARIEIMLCIFIVAFFIHSINYSETGKKRSLLLSGLFLLLAIFTKETTIAAIPVCVLILVLVLRKRLFEKRNVVQYCLWAICFAVYLTARTLAHIHITANPGRSMWSEFANRLPLLIQYLGKIFFPFNLAVFPLQQDTVYYYGFAALALLSVAVYLSVKDKARTSRQSINIMLLGLAIFLLFLIPSLLVPGNISMQSYEYRLYIPVSGILLILSQTLLFNNKLSDKKLLAGGTGIFVFFAALNINYQKNFDSPLAFWSNAATTAPHSAYANMMLAARCGDEQQADKLFIKAFALNPNERLLNYIYATMLLNKDSVQASEKYLLAEKRISGYAECDFYLARVDMERKDLYGAIGYLESYLKSQPTNKMANDNLLLLYLDTDQDNKAIAQAKNMLQRGLKVPDAVLKQFHL